MTERFYPKPGRYFAPLSDDRPLFQGDIIRGVFGAWWRHPESVRATLAGHPRASRAPVPGAGRAALERAGARQRLRDAAPTTMRVLRRREGCDTTLPCRRAAVPTRLLDATFFEDARVTFREDEMVPERSPSEVGRG